MSEPLTALLAAFDPAKHPHRPGGDSHGGEWAPKGDYRGQHTSPDHESGTPASDLANEENGVFPADVYGPDGARLYGHGGDAEGRRMDAETIRILRTIRGKPDAQIEVFRGVPRGVTQINPNDWVTVNRQYAELHSLGNLGDTDGDGNPDEGVVISRKVRAGDLYTDGNSIHEFGWDPGVHAAAAPINDRMSAEEFSRAVYAGTRVAEAALLDRLADAYRRALVSVSGDAARRFKTQARALTAAFDPTLAAALEGENPEPQFVAPNPDDLVPVTKLAAEIEKRTKKLREQIVHVTVGPSMASVGISFEPGGIFSRSILDQVGARIPDAYKSTRDAIRTAIDRAQREGLTVPQTAGLIQKEIVELSDATATQLARTDLIGTSNASATAAARQVFRDEPVRKRWLATEDERTRPTHRDADGQTVPLDGKFTVGTSLMDYPGDPKGPDDEVCNCRCTVLFEEVALPATQRSEGFGATLGRLQLVRREQVQAGQVPGLTWSAEDFAKPKIQVAQYGIIVGPGQFVPDGRLIGAQIIETAGRKLAKSLLAEALGIDEALIPVRIERGRLPGLGFEFPDTKPESVISKAWERLVTQNEGGQQPDQQNTGELRVDLLNRIKATAARLGYPTEKLYRVAADGTLSLLDKTREKVTEAAHVRSLEAIRAAEAAVEQAATVDPARAAEAVALALAAAVTDASYADVMLAAAVDHAEGSMVALHLDADTAATLAALGGQAPDTLHVTLAVLPDGVEDPEEVAQILSGLAAWLPEFAGQVGGLGMFQPGPDGVPVIALPDVPGLDAARVAVVEALEEAGVVVAQNHGFTPHITIGYGPGVELDTDVFGLPLHFDALSLVVGAERWDLPLGGSLVAAFDPSEHPHRPAGDARGGEWASKTMYHVAPVSQRENITREGLQDKLTQQGVFVWATKEDAKKYRDQVGGDVWEVDPTGLQLDADPWWDVSGRRAMWGAPGQSFVVKVGGVPSRNVRLNNDALTAAFDPALHPHRPGGDSHGGEWAAKVGVTPFRPEDNPEGFYDSPKYKMFERSLGPTAKRYGVTIDAQDRVSGYWQGSQEPSLALDVHDGETGVQNFAADLRSRWDQDAVLLFHPSETGDAMAFKLPADGDVSGALTAVGIDGATIYDGGVEVIGDESTAKQVLELAQKLGVDPGQVQVRSGNLAFVER